MTKEDNQIIEAVNHFAGLFIKSIVAGYLVVLGLIYIFDYPIQMILAALIFYASYKIYKIYNDRRN